MNTHLHAYPIYIYVYKYIKPATFAWPCPLSGPVGNRHANNVQYNMPYTLLSIYYGIVAHVNDTARIITYNDSMRVHLHINPPLQDGLINSFAPECLLHGPQVERPVPNGPGIGPMPLDFLWKWFPLPGAARHPNVWPMVA